MWLRPALVALVLLFLSVPLLGLVTGGDWRAASLSADDLAAIATSLLGGSVAICVIALVGTPVALYLARVPGRVSAVAEALVLIPMLMPTLALGILLAAFYGPAASVGAMFARVGVMLSNSWAAFVLAALYAAMPTYIIAAKVALAEVPLMYEQVARTLGDTPGWAFWRVTLPLAQRGLAAALALCWMRAMGEFGIVLIIAYFPAGMPVRLWIDVQDQGVASVFPLLGLFLLVALPLPLWLGLRRRKQFFF